MDSTSDSRHSEAIDQLQGGKLVVGAASVTLVILLLTWVLQKRATAPQKPRLPPGPRDLPLLGAIHHLGSRPYRSLQRLSMKYGPLMFMHFGSLPAVVVSNADMAEAIYKTHDLAFASRPVWSIFSCLFYNGKDIIFAPYGSEWRQLRKVCTLELLTKFRINQFQHKREQEVHSMVQSILKESQNGDAVRMDTYFGDLTMNIITKVMWNKSYRGSWATSAVDGPLGKKGFSDIVRELSEVANTNSLGDIFPTFKFILENIQGLHKRAARVHQRMDEFLSDIVSEHKQRRSSFLSEAARETADGADDFVDVLLKHSMTQSKEKEHISEESIKALLTDMIVGGTNTPAVTLEWALAELVRRPDLMSKAQAELSSVVGSERLVNETDIPNLSYLNAILKETLRMHPPAPMAVPHLAREDCKIDGFHVSAGTRILINLWAIHRDPAKWERPWDFDPERFLGNNAGADIDWTGQHFQLVPFGSGRRMCPGINLASSIIHLALAQAVHTINWSLPGNQKLEELDMAEKIGYEGDRAIPLTLLAKPRLSQEVIFPRPSRQLFT